MNQIVAPILRSYFCANPYRDEPVLHKIFSKQHNFRNVKPDSPTFDGDEPVFSFCYDDHADDIIKPNRDPKGLNLSPYPFLHLDLTTLFD